MTEYKIGIDVGGTFTDLFLASSEGAVATFKTSSTPEDPSIGVLNGLRLVAEAEGRSVREFIADVTSIVHGTTVTTNATLTRGGAKTALLTTEGVRDALEMRRGVREEQYDNHLENVAPLVPRNLRLGIRGRINYAGRELTPLDTEGVHAAARALREQGVESVALCFMNSFANQEHEEAAARILREEFPEAHLSVSSRVLRTVRFYNRVSTTALDAYVGPILRDYLRSLTVKLAELGFGGVLLIMQSNGGVALPDVAQARPATTLLSGPAGGPVAAVAYTRFAGRDDCILVDMGGTSFDASLVRGGEAEMVSESDIERLRIALPMLAITTIGAGGGSIGWIDEGGLLRMGPESAGAEPGPACYGRGGERPTCTDANLALGYLDPDYFAGGKMALDADAARHAIELHVAHPLGMEIDEAAAGMYRVINTNMAHGVREITVRRGLDPRVFPLVVAGGAGALHACMIANELEIPELCVPPTASVLCATGMLLGDLRQDTVRSYVCRFTDLDLDRLRGLVSEMAEEGVRVMREQGIAPDRIGRRVQLDLRYLKQYHEVTVAVPEGSVEAGDLTAIAEAFHREHNRLFGYDLRAEGTGLELINVRMRVTGTTAKPRLPRIAVAAGGAGVPGRKGARRAFVPETSSFQEVPVFDGPSLAAGCVLEGPALIERTDTTIFVSDSFRARIDDHGSCLLKRKEA